MVVHVTGYGYFTFLHYFFTAEAKVSDGLSEIDAFKPPNPSILQSNPPLIVASRVKSK